MMQTCSTNYFHPLFSGFFIRFLDLIYNNDNRHLSTVYTGNTLVRVHWLVTDLSLSCFEFVE